MAVPRFKNKRSAERRKIDMAIKTREKGIATSGGRISAKKARRGLEARNLPLTRKPAKATATKQGSTKQKTGRHRTNKGVGKTPMGKKR